MPTKKMNFMSTDFDLAENVFYFHNSRLKSLAFVLHWDTEEKLYFNLLSKSFADVFDLPNDHSMVLVKPGQTNYCNQKIPAFDIKYIEDCFKIKDYPDPTKYLIENTNSGNYTKNDILDCWLYQNKSWSDLIPIPGNKNNNCKIVVESSSTNSSISQVTRKTMDEITFIFGEFKQIFYVMSDDHYSCNNDFDDKVLFNRLAPSYKHTRMPYSHKEEMNIVSYIIKNKYALDIKGRAMWQRMEHANVCKLRTWQSMKERYLKSIKYDLTSGNHRFPFLTPNDLKLLRQGLNIEQLNKEDKDAIKSRLNDERIDNLSSDST